MQADSPIEDDVSRMLRNHEFPPRQNPPHSTEVKKGLDGGRSRVRTADLLGVNQTL